MNNEVKSSSLDWIKDLIDINKHNLRIYTEENDIGSMQDTTRELKYLKQTEADLEVLEMLKPHLINAGIGKYDDVGEYELLHLKLTLSGKEYNTIKEWLENDK